MFPTVHEGFPEGIDRMFPTKFGITSILKYKGSMKFLKFNYLYSKSAMCIDDNRRPVIQGGITETIGS